MLPDGVGFGELGLVGGGAWSWRLVSWMRRAASVMRSLSSSENM